ncbi:MAG: 5-(carboxyamino)imidazole ribonucleotide mutase [Dysgonamonadaceae bacterium]|jgi:5-(carboxyamino)imidazole ribonucleotide mutase|nr:5-(carboxyamino)imidazole ribonucleotide mutase [Dysgonamonadaceae bacterium]
MKARVSIIMGSTSDLPVMEKAAEVLNEFKIPFEIRVLSAHRTPQSVEDFASNALEKGIEVIIAAAGMSAALPGVIAANTVLPVIGVPLSGHVLGGVDSLYSMIQMPPGVPVATVGIDSVVNAALFAIQILALRDESISLMLANRKSDMNYKVIMANETLKHLSYEYKTN